MTVATTHSKASLLGQSVDLHLVIPNKWPGYAAEPVSTPKDFQLHLLPVSFAGHNHFHFYHGFFGLLSKLKPDLLHVDEEPWSLVTGQAFLAAKKLNIPAIAYTAQNIKKRYPPPFSWIEQMVYRYSSAILPCNQEAVEVLRAKGYRGPAPVLPQFGLDPIQFLPQRSTSTNAKILEVCYVGRLVPEKGIDSLISAVASSPSARLTIVGVGPYEAALRAQSELLGISDRIRFFGGIASTKVVEFLCSTQVLVLPSLTTRRWKEQFGRVLIEAMAAGVVVVGSDSGEIPHVIGDAGLVFPEGDSKALAACLDRLTDPTLRDALILRGYKQASRYTQEAVAAETLNIYRQILQ